MATIRGKIVDAVDCGCCPVDEGIVEEIEKYLTDLNYTVEDIGDEEGAYSSDIAAMYQFALWKKRRDLSKEIAEQIGLEVGERKQLEWQGRSWIMTRIQ